MEDFEFVSPTHFVFGHNAESKVGPMLAERGARKVLLHYGGQSAIKSGLIDRVCASLEQAGIEEGDTVILNENGELRKVLSGDWTQNCNSKNVDTTKFVNMMQAVKAGKQIDWICPFCSGTVERLEQKGGKTVIGCTSCDMRIQIEN